MYELSEKDRHRLQTNFRYHAPFGDQPKRYEAIRACAGGFAQLLMEYCPPSRELSQALTDVEDAVMHANAAISRNEAAPVPEIAP